MTSIVETYLNYNNESRAIDSQLASIEEGLRRYNDLAYQGIETQRLGLSTAQDYMQNALNFGAPYRGVGEGALNELSQLYGLGRFEGNVSQTTGEAVAPRLPRGTAAEAPKRRPVIQPNIPGAVVQEGPNPAAPAAPAAESPFEYPDRIQVGTGKGGQPVYADRVTEQIIEQNGRNSRAIDPVEDFDTARVTSGRWGSSYGYGPTYYNPASKKVHNYYDTDDASPDAFKNHISSERAAAAEAQRQQAAVVQQQEAAEQETALRNEVRLTPESAPVAAGAPSAGRPADEFSPVRNGLITPDYEFGIDRAKSQQDAFSRFKASPDYQFRLEEGLKSIDRLASAGNYRGSTRAAREANRYGSGLASQEYGNYVGRLGQLAGFGFNGSGQASGVATNQANSALGTARGISDVYENQGINTQTAFRDLGDLNADKRGALNEGTTNILGQIGDFISNPIASIGDVFGL